MGSRWRRLTAGRRAEEKRTRKRSQEWAHANQRGRKGKERRRRRRALNPFNHSRMQ